MRKQNLKPAGGGATDTSAQQQQVTQAPPKGWDVAGQWNVEVLVLIALAARSVVAIRDQTVTKLLMADLKVFAARWLLKGASQLEVSELTRPHCTIPMAAWHQPPLHFEEKDHLAVEALPWCLPTWTLQTRPGEPFHTGTCSGTSVLHRLSCNQNCQHLRCHDPSCLGRALGPWNWRCPDVPRLD